MTMLSYGHALSASASRQPEAVALIHEGQSTTYSELEAGANRLARTFLALGVEEGDFVTISLPNGRKVVETFFACWKLGATPQPVSSRLPEHEREAIIALVDPKLLVVESSASGRSGLPSSYPPRIQKSPSRRIPPMPHPLRIASRNIGLRSVRVGVRVVRRSSWIIFVLRSIQNRIFTGSRRGQVFWFQAPSTTRVR